MKKDFSLIIACFNEEPHLNQSVNEIEQVLSKTKYSYELIFVDDKSTDNTKNLIEKMSKGKKNYKFLFHEVNQGRGKTVSDGIKLSKSKYVGFIDIDLETPAIYLFKLLLELNNGFDVVTANRIYTLNMKSFHRFILSRGYNFLQKILLKNNLEDTETGCKLFNRKKIIPILNKVKDKEWFWDTEIMALCKLNGLKIKEVPTVFIRKEDKKSTVKIFRDTLKYFYKLIEFTFRIRKGGN